MSRNRFTAEQKLAILEEGKRDGVTQTCRKHDIHFTTFYGWKQKFELEGLEGLKSVYKRTDPQVKRLLLENQRLKQLLAEKELALNIKDELLKKTTSRGRTGL
jgi:putative transposase